MRVMGKCQLSGTAFLSYVFREPPARILIALLAVVIACAWWLPRLEAIRYRRKLDLSAETGERIAILQQIAGKGSHTAAASSARDYVGKAFRDSPSYGVGLVGSAKELWLGLTAGDLAKHLGDPTSRTEERLLWQVPQTRSGITWSLVMEMQGELSATVIVRSAVAEGAVQ